MHEKCNLLCCIKKVISGCVRQESSTPSVTATGSPPTAVTVMGRGGSMEEATSLLTRAHRHRLGSMNHNAIHMCQQMVLTLLESCHVLCLKPFPSCMVKSPRENSQEFLRGSSLPILTASPTGKEVSQTCHPMQWSVCKGGAVWALSSAPSLKKSSNRQGPGSCGWLSWRRGFAQYGSCLCESCRKPRK